MSQKNVFNVATLGELVDTVTKNVFNTVSLNENLPLWFRGHEDMSWKLNPSLYRKIGQNGSNGKVRKDKIDKPWEELREKEKWILDEFKVRNYHLLEGRWPENEYMWLCLMQHYGTATRLLDWSEQLLSSVLFALESYFNIDHPSTGVLPCIWVLNPLKMISVIEKSSIKVKSCVSEKQCKCPFPSSTKNVIPNLLNLCVKDDDIRHMRLSVPIPTISPYNNERIRAQGGTFILFPNHMQGKIKPEDFTLNEFEKAEEYLAQIVIVQPKFMSDQLKRLGYKRSLFYPEVPNVSIEIEEKFLREINKIAH